MSRRNLVAAVLALIVAAVCVRLGIWQLDRLAERRARNAQVAARIREPPISLSDSLVNGSPERFHRVRVNGTFDFDHEIIVTGRTRNGSPGVHIVTPLRVDGSESVVLVNRGWVYAPDAVSVDLPRWREPAQAALEGYVEEFPESRPGDPRSGTDPRALRWLHRPSIAKMLPYPIAPFYVVALADASPGGNTPARIPIPSLDEGPHRSYAFQWFAFAAIAVIGVSVLMWQDRRSRPGAAGGDRSGRTGVV